ncbi:hypothetical protein JVU11DRAFT_6819 [Chiua virens]|nr:hypothetical protein JVU11DRAFT_6819 [Chiua virens]
MSSFQLVAPLTEVASDDQVCKRTFCKELIPRGSPYYPVVGYDASMPPRKMCQHCYEECLRLPGTAVRETYPASMAVPDPQQVRVAVNASQSRSTVNPPALVAIPPRYGVGISRMNLNPPAPPAQLLQSRGSQAMLPPSLPTARLPTQLVQSRGSQAMLPPSLPAARLSRTGPRVDVPATWSTTGPVSIPKSSNCAVMPHNFASYNESHAYYPTETQCWSGLARGTLPSAETISLSIVALREGGQRRGRLNGTPFGNIIEGKKGIDAHITASGLVAVAREILVPNIIAFCPEFPWCVDEFVIRDDSWVDLANHAETAENPLGYFYQDCLQCKGKGFVFKTRQFPIYVVVPQNQWTDYEEFIVKKNGPPTELDFKSTSKSGATSRRCSAHDTTQLVNTSPGASRHRSTHDMTQLASHHRQPNSMTAPLSSIRSPPAVSLQPLFLSLNDEQSDDEGPISKSLVKPATVSSPISIKRAYSTRPSSAASSTTKSLPTKKMFVIKSEPLSPNRDNLREALRVSGTADLDTTQILKNSVYQIDFYPIPTVSIKLILRSPNHCKFDLDPKKNVTILHPGQLRLGGQDESYVGAGAFKTAYTATLILSKPTATGIGSKPHETIIIKRPYIRRPNQDPFSTGPFKRLGIKEESEKLFREANVLYWAKALFKLAEDYIAKRIAKETEPPPFKIPSICFVDAALTFRYPATPVRGPRTPSIDCTYLCEEEIEGADMVFLKFIHNGNCVPLPRPGDTGHDVAEFLAFTQHIQYVKTKGSTYVSDYQGTTSLLTDPQILTHPDIGHDLFCEGNLEKAVELFEDEHICNKFCKWPGFKLVPFRGNWKGKGKALDPVILSSDSK